MKAVAYYAATIYSALYFTFAVSIYDVTNDPKTVLIEVVDEKSGVRHLFSVERATMDEPETIERIVTSVSK